MMDIVQADFDCIGNVAKHCDNDKLCIAIEEAKTFDVEPLLCDMFADVDDNWTSYDDIWVDLIDGSTYEDCKGKTRRHLGVKRMWVYYAYARYITLNGFSDTPNGQVSKTNPWSVPKSLNELEAYSDKYRDMGYRTWKGVEAFMCANQGDYEDFNPKNCADCGCGTGDCGGTKAKGYGIRGKEVTKHGL